MLRWRRWATNVVLRSISDDKVLKPGKNVGWVVQRHSSIVPTAQCPNRVVGVTSTPTPIQLLKASAAQDRSATTTSNVLTSTQVQNLRRALSTRPLDPSALYTAYLASKPHLTYLTRSEFSNLIAAFGALSDYPNAERLPRADGFVVTEWLREALAGVTFGQKWWDVVLEVGANQSALGRRTADVDRYWLMLAHLGRYRSQGQDQVYHGDRTDGDMHNLKRVHHSDRVGTHNQESDSMKNRHAARDRLPTGSTQHLAHARIHYTALARNHLDESVHYAYLRALLDVYPALAEARIHLADALSQLLTNTRFRFEPRLARLFWSVIHTVEFIPPERQALLDALALRASTHKHVPRTQGLNHRLDSGSDEDPVLALRHAILDFSTSDEPWVRREAELIVLHHQQSEGWSSLVALAGGTPPRALAHPPRRINVLLGLRQGEEHQQLEVLWDVWMAILGAEIRQDETRSGLGEIGTVKIDRAILLRFLRAAAIRRSDRVVSGVERLLLVMSCVVFERDGIEKAEAVEDPRGSLSVVLGAAWACLGTTNLTVLYARIQAAGFKTQDGRFPNTYLAKLIEVLAFRAPSVAWLIAQQCKGSLPMELVSSLASVCARTGLLDQAVSLLSDARLSTDTKFSIAVVCLQQCSRRRVILSRRNALEMCDWLGPRLDHVPIGLRHTAIWMTLNAGLVRLAGLMGARWSLSSRMQRKLAARLVKARLCGLALRVMDTSQTCSLARLSTELKAGLSLSNNRFTGGKIDAIRNGNTLISRAGRRRRKILGGRAQMRATLAVLARLLRPHQSPRGHNNSSTARVDARLSFAPDAVTLNVLCRALARCTSGLASPRLRALFDQLAQAGICGPPGYHFGTNEADGRDRFIVALAEMVRGSDARVSFVRHTRPLLKTFLRGFQVRRDEEAARVVGDLLEAEDNAWRSGQRT